MGFFTQEQKDKVKNYDKSLAWETIHDSIGMRIKRSKIFGGWLVLLHNDSITYVPDPKHEWDGKSVT